jgi:hypothetical protein
MKPQEGKTQVKCLQISGSVAREKICKEENMYSTEGTVCLGEGAVVGTAVEPDNSGSQWTQINCFFGRIFWLLPVSSRCPRPRADLGNGFG